MERPDYIRPDPRLRWQAALTVIAASTAGTLGIGWVLPWLLPLLRTALETGQLSFPMLCALFLSTVGLLAAPVVGFGVYAVRFGRRVLASGRYPPPGTRVLRRTRIVRGPAAMLTGKGQVAVGVALLVSGLALVALAFWGTLRIAYLSPPAPELRPASRPEEAGASAAALGRPSSAIEDGSLQSPFSSRTVLLIEATAEEIETAGADVASDDFAVIADDLMFYRAAAAERLEDAGVPLLRVEGRRPLWFTVGEETRALDARELPTLDRIVVYLPGRDPTSFATVDVERALELYLANGGEG